MDKINLSQPLVPVRNVMMQLLTPSDKSCVKSLMARFLTFNLLLSLQVMIRRLYTHISC